MKKKLTYFLLLWALAGCMDGPHEAADTTDPSAPIRGEYIVTTSGGPDSSDWEYLYSGFGIKEVKYLGSRTFLVRLNDDPGIQRMQRVGSRNKHIASVQPNFIYRVASPTK